MSKAHEIILINVSGPDKPGLTKAMSTVLARHSVQILDIGQAVIHDTVNLGMLIMVPSGNDSAVVVKDLVFWAHESDMVARFTPIDEENYQAWVNGQGKNRYIVTLLARQISAEQIAAISRITSEHGLTIDDIDRLSGRVHLDADDIQEKACVVFSVRGQPKNIDTMRSEFLSEATKLNIDIAFQRDSVYRRNRRLVAFDMDSTLIEAEVIDELAKAAGVGDQVVAITERAMQGELDFSESFKQRVALLKGLDESVLADIARKLPLTEGAERLVRCVKALGYKTAILSGGFNYFGRYLQERLGIDYVYANELEIVDGKVSGQVQEPIVDGQRKAFLLQEIAKKEDINLEQVIAVGDGANDLPMLSIAGLGIAFRAKPLVKESAKQAISTLGLDGILYLLGVDDKAHDELLGPKA